MIVVSRFDWTLLAVAVLLITMLSLAQSTTYERFRSNALAVRTLLIWLVVLGAIAVVTHQGPPDTP